MFEFEFLQALRSSQTFYTLIMQCSVAALVVLVALFLLYARFRPYFQPNRFRDLVSNETGSAAAIDFVITMPFFVLMLTVFVQLAMIANSALIVHYAAFSAARSARVHMWHRDVWWDKLDDYVIDSEDSSGLFSVLYAKNATAATKAAYNAAKWVLIAASPVSESVTRTSANVPENIIRRIVSQNLPESRQGTILRQASYAYDEQNTGVEIIPAALSASINSPGHLQEILMPSNAWPIKATVRFRKYLSVPLAGVAFGTRSAQGRYFRWIEAEVTLL